MPGCNERNTFPDEYGHDADNELVNRTLVKERRDDLTSTHQPDVLACLLAEALGKSPDRFRDELDSGRSGCRGSLSREDVMQIFRVEVRTQLHTHVEGLATENFGID